MPDVDARVLRLQQGAVTVALLAGFVFQVQWMIPAAAARAQALCVFGALVVATLVLLAGLGTLATLLAIVVAGVSAFAATGLFSLGAELDRRSRPRRRGGSGRRPERDS